MLLRQRLTNIAKHLPHCMLVNQFQCTTPSERFGFLLLWYESYHRTAIKYAPAMVPHTATHGDTFVNTVSRQSTLSQVAQLPHCRLWLDIAFPVVQPALPQPAQHMQPTPAAPATLASQMSQAPAVLTTPAVQKNAPAPMSLNPMPHLCSHKDLAMPAWHQDAWSRRSRNYQPRLSTDLVIIMHHHLHPQ